MNRPQPGWIYYWLGVTVFVIFVLFAIPEAIALMNDDAGDTYSEVLSYYFQDIIPAGKWIFAIGMTVFFVWFVPHIVLRKYKTRDGEDNGDKSV
jgi:Na+/proline symporter